MRSLIAIAAMVACSGTWADVTLPNNLQENSVASATDVMDNFNALASEVNSQDSRITIVEQSVGGGTTTRTFTFSGWVDLENSPNCSNENQGDFIECLGINGLNLRCKSEFGDNYAAASLDVLGEALKYGVPITFPTTGYCGGAITNYDDYGVWWLPLKPNSGIPMTKTDNSSQLEFECGSSLGYDISFMCGYWD